MTRKRVQVHTRHLPWCTTRNRSPFCCAELQCSQHLKWYVRNLTRFALLKDFEVASNVRQRIERVITSDEVSEQRFTRSVLWLRVDHLHDVSQRRVLTNIGLEERCWIASIEPLTHETLWRRTKRLATDCSRTHDLHKVAEHLWVINHARKHARQHFAVLD